MLLNLQLRGAWVDYAYIQTTGAEGAADNAWPAGWLSFDSMLGRLVRGNRIDLILSVRDAS